MNILDICPDILSIIISKLKEISQFYRFINYKIQGYKVLYDRKLEICSKFIYVKPIHNLLEFLDYATIMQLKKISIESYDLDTISIIPLINLKSISLAYNKFCDISYLKYLRNLIELNMNSNCLESLASIEKHTQLKILELQYNNLENIENIKNLDKLIKLDLSRNRLKSIKSLSCNVNLIELSLRCNNIEDISSLEKLVNLRKLNLDHNNLVNTEAFKYLVNLKELHLSYNKIDNLIWLSNLKSINKLGLSYNKIKDISPLKNLLTLKYLWLNQNQISDILPLITLFNTIVYMGTNPINNFLSAKQKLIKNGVKIVL